MRLDSDSCSHKDLYLDLNWDFDSDENNDDCVCDTTDDCDCCCFFDTDDDFYYCCIIGDDCDDICYFDAYGRDIEKLANRNMPDAEFSLAANCSNVLGWSYSTVGNTGQEKLSSGSFDFIHSNALVFAAVIALI